MGGSSSGGGGIINSDLGGDIENVLTRKGAHLCFLERAHTRRGAQHEELYIG